LQLLHFGGGWFDWRTELIAPHWGPKVGDYVMSSDGQFFCMWTSKTRCDGFSSEIADSFTIFTDPRSNLAKYKAELAERNEAIKRCVDDAPCRLN
jgi:hypothetical protein